MGKVEILFIVSVHLNMKIYLFLLKGLRAAGNNPNTEYSRELF